MTTLIFHLTVTMPLPDASEMTLYLLGVLIMLTTAAIHWMIRRTRVVVVISGTTALVAVLAVLCTAYLIKSGVV
jgi:hypothetical protein